MSQELERWEFGDPAEVVERRELQEIARAAREADRVLQELQKRAMQERMRALVFKKAGMR